MVNRGMSKPLWIIAIVLVILLIGGIVVLIAPTIPGEVTVTTGEVTDHDLQTSVKVTLEGEMDFYDLFMTGPEGSVVGGAFITKTQMVDGKQSVWVPLESHLGPTAAKPGAYLLAVTDYSRNNVYYKKTLGPYSGSDLSVINIGTISTSYVEYGGYAIESIPITCKNDGDLPAYVTIIDIKIDTRKDSSAIEKVILPGETATITAKFIFLGRFDEGDYSASFKLKEGPALTGKTVATYTKTISIP